MKNMLDKPDIFINYKINNYTIIKPLKSGNVGSVYLAKNDELDELRAIKFISKDRVDEKPTWEQEIKKVIKLRLTEGVVHYHEHGIEKIDDEEYLYIMWDYIESDSLADLIEKSEVTIQLLINVIERSLNVFFACDKLKMQHADFHAGNILIQYPDELSMNGEIRKVWITDFGYGTFSNEIPPMDDYKGLARIIEQTLEKIDFHRLEKEDRVRYKVLKNEFPKYLHEENILEGDFVRNPRMLLEKMNELFSKKGEVAHYNKAVGDYLSAELIGDRYDEWDALFVPKFMAAQELLDKNICVLTGLRGCGKTMTFRRLSEPMVSILGKPGIRGEDDFIGFYINARSIAEAFPWLPNQMKEQAREQVCNYFHLRWSVEILEWLKSQLRNSSLNEITWIVEFFAKYFDSLELTSNSPSGIFNELISLCHAEINNSKLEDKYNDNKKWAFAEYDYLEVLFSHIIKYCSFAKDKTFYLFLDDYSTPMVTEATQLILNPIVFRRCPLAFFKVSTESVESFNRTGFNGKVLEEGADYKLIELGMETLKRKDEEVEEIIASIFSKRIERNAFFKGKSLTLERILGKTDFSFVEMANKIKENDKKTIYYGFEVFCRSWSSDIRELIKLFADMVDKEGDASLKEKSNNNYEDEKYIISKENQDHVFREAGGRFLHLLSVATNPSRTNITPDIDVNINSTYGEHLYDIVSSFQEIAYHDLKTKLSKNKEFCPPKQARKIEMVTANGKLSETAKDYLDGLIRYGVFIQDYRGKSVRGTVATRLYLRSLLIPYARLTFSKRDSISLSWEDLEELLLHPREFSKKYIKKTAKPNSSEYKQLSWRSEQ